MLLQHLRKTRLDIAQCVDTAGKAGGVVDHIDLLAAPRHSCQLEFLSELAMGERDKTVSGSGI